MNLSPDEYGDMINKYSIEYYSKIDEQKQICVNGYEEYDKAQCKKIKDKISSIKNKFEEISQSIRDNINILSNNIDNTDKEIDIYNKKNDKLKNKLERAINSEAGAQGLLIDTVYLHNQQLFGNWILFLTMVFLCYYNRISSKQIIVVGGNIAGNVKETFSDMATKLGKK